MPLPVKDRIIKRKNQFEDELVVAVAARISEEIVFGAENVASGAVSDIQQATAMARQMVTEFGFSEKLGFIRYSNNQEEVFLGHSVTQSKNMSEETAKLIDEEVKRLIDDAKTKARKILIDHKDELHIVAQGLLEYETLSGDEINDLIKGIKPSRDEFDDGNSSNPVPPKPSVPKTGSTTAPQPN
jgi:cell division protease FtsH